MFENAFHVFHQIGALMYYKGDYEKNPKSAMEDSDNWKDTGFAAVSNVTSGKALRVWLVFDFFPYDPSVGETLPCRH